MTDEQVQVGTLEKRADGRFEGKLSRVYEGHSPAEVWRMLTEPDHMMLWLAPGTIELRKGGAVNIDFKDSGIVVDSEVLAFEPEHVLAFSWGGKGDPQRPLHWQMDAEGDDVRVTLTIGLPAGEDAAKACAGFEGHLEMLAAALEDVPVKFPLDLYLAARKAYAAQIDQ